MGSKFQMVLVLILVGLSGLVVASRAGLISLSEGGLVGLTPTTNISSANKSLPADLTYSSVEELYDQLKDQYEGELSEEELLDGLKKGLVDAAGDQYTTFFNEEEAEAFDASLNGSFTGIGAELGLDEASQLIIVAPLKGFPAESAGLLAQDRIISVDGVSTADWSVEEAVNVIRGEEGSEVVLGVARSNETLDVAITRQKIVVPSVEWELLEGNIGLIELSRFADDSSSLMKQAAEELLDQGATSVIVDVRNNGGGLLSASVNIASLWVDGDVIVEQRRGDEVFDSQNAGSGAILGDIPTVLLVNAGSASASEILAGALQDYDKATLIGTQTFGKGSVQTLSPVDDGGVLKVTTARWYTPEGQNIDDEGISPDVEVERSVEDITAEIDPQLEAAIAELQ